MMRKISFLMILCITAVVLLFANCDKNCKIKYPKDLKPIDWENYNDVYTVYWNYCTVSSETNKKIEQDRDKDIMIYGWVCFPHSINHEFALSEYPNGSGIMCTIGILPPIDTINNIVGQVRVKLDTSDLTKKCFIKGVLRLRPAPVKGCKCVPHIDILDVNDIYFK